MSMISSSEIGIGYQPARSCPDSAMRRCLRFGPMTIPESQKTPATI
jgi:hypothetical protein